MMMMKKKKKKKPGRGVGGVGKKCENEMLIVIVYSISSCSVSG